ncbi:flippase-like domain-containing protein [Alcanivorax sp. 1008]|nr:flippase-like domain-containing protein [Alcanivorax sp. 1008]
MAIPIALGGRDALTLITTLRIGDIFTLLAIMVVVWHLNLLKLRILMSGKLVNLGYWRMARIYMAAEFVSKTTPAGSGAPVAAIALLAPHNVSASTCIAIFCVVGCMDAIVLIFYIGIFALTGLSGILGGSAVTSVLLLALVMACAIFATYLLISRHKLLITVADAMLRILTVGPSKRRTAHKALISLHRAIKKITKLPPWRLAISWAACLLYWILYLSTLYLSILLIGGQISWTDAGFIQIIAMGVGHLLMIPGGIGGSEITSAVLLTPLLGAAISGSAILIWRFLMLYLYLIVGGLSMLSLIASPSKPAKAP